MRAWLEGRFASAYERLLKTEIDGAPDHVAVIQDGNRRFARKRGEEAADGHRAGAETSEQIIEWCGDLGVEELTLYAFSTENSQRPDDEREHLFDLFETKLREFGDAERIHDNEIRICVIGDLSALPERVKTAAAYAERRTATYRGFTLNVAIGYGGRRELLDTVRAIGREVETDSLEPEQIDVSTLEDQLHTSPTRAVDLIIRPGGDERTSNFLPWHANGNEAAAVFCAPYWPGFTKLDFLRAIRTYEQREESWRRARVQRALSLVRAFGGIELDEARSVLERFREHVPSSDTASASALQRNSESAPENNSP